MNNSDFLFLKLQLRKMSSKKYINSDSLHKLSVELATKIHKDNYNPTWIVGLWRGGCQPCIIVQGFLKHYGNNANHISVRTSGYNVDGQQSSHVRVHGTEYLVKCLNESSIDEKLLIVDDIFDSGRSMEAFLVKLKQKLGDKYPKDIRIATLFYKPLKNKTRITPNYYVEETSEWLVFPHEFDDLTKDEIKEFMDIDMP